MSGRASQSACGKAAAYGAIHAVVDAASVLAIWRTGASTAVQFMTSFAVVFGYDLLAFAGQGPLGALVDRFKASRAAAIAGLVLAAAAVLCAPYSAVATMIVAGVGNALFHLGAGASVLRSSEGRAAPAGIFVAPGALGLALGMWMGKTGNGPAWPFVALLLLAPVLVDAIHVREGAMSQEVEAPRLKPGSFSLVLALLLFSVVVRSFVGFGACHECPGGTVLLVGIPLAAFTGKLIGGFLADRLGWVETSVAALLLCAPLVAFNGGSLAPALGGLLLLQLTMPVTLAATFRLMPGHPALAFGLPCVALVAGAVPTFFDSGRDLFGPATFIALLVASAAALALGLRVGAVPWRRSALLGTADPLVEGGPT
jgi:FSR family fosmidomycin resistance protein-like MFS transporter